MLQFYNEVFEMPVATPGTARMTVLNKAHGLDIETEHPLAMARLPKDYALEIDGYPDTATIRPQRQGELPPALAMIGFEIDSLDGLGRPLLAPAKAIHARPYNGRRVGVMRGAAGELIELIEAR